MSETLPYLNAYLHNNEVRKLIQVGSRWMGTNKSQFCKESFIITNIKNGIVHYEYESDRFCSDKPIDYFIKSFDERSVIKLN